MQTEAPNINFVSLGLTMFFITAIPVGAGLVTRAKIKNFAKSFESIATKISTILFVIIVLGALASEWQTFTNNVYKIGPAIILLITSMLIIGYKSSNWFKMNRRQSVTVAIESSIQNATVGITIGNIIINPEIGLSILSIPSGVYGIIMYFVCLPFVIWWVK